MCIFVSFFVFNRSCLFSSIVIVMLFTFSILYREEKKEKEDKEKKRKIKRFVLIGAAAVGGGALIGNCF